MPHSAFYFKGFDSPSENIITLSIGDYNDLLYEKKVRFTATFLANVNWDALLKFYNDHSLDFLMKVGV